MSRERVNALFCFEELEALEIETNWLRTWKPAFRNELNNVNIVSFRIPPEIAREFSNMLYTISRSLQPPLVSDSHVVSR